ncbi:MAG: PEGA domain-containing protein [Myxococcales bacterium]|nr:PEGA domain-containing protein [Polyangiaceae bacterium]MDW8248117.1 PEGA domain-containing protein [Myxococcales bacterium]
MYLAPRATPALSLCVGLAILAPSLPAVAQPSAPSKEEARSRYERGKQLYEEGAFDAALIEFQRAYDLAPSYKILFNIGQVHRQRNDYASALRVFERYLKEGGAEIDVKRRTEVEKEIAQLKGRVATLEITTNVPGAEILVDDESVGKTPLPQGVLVNSGKRKITASKEGHVPVSKVINVAGADTMKITLELVESSGGGASSPPTILPTTTPTTTPTSSGASSPPAGTSQSLPLEKPSVPWLAWTITGAFGVGTAVTGILALGASNDLKNKRSQPDVNRKELDDGSSRTKNLALVSDLLLVGTAIAGGVSIYLTVSEPSKESSARLKGPVRLGAGPGALTLTGSF